MASVDAPVQRSAARFAVALPITLEGEEGATHDLSATGILFESPKAPEMGALVDLTLKHQADGREMDLVCQGEVVRVERHGDGFNVAVRLTQPLFAEP